MFDEKTEIKALRGMVGTCFAQLAELEKVVIGVQVKAHKLHLNQDPGLSEAETEEGEDLLGDVVEPEANRLDRIFCENVATTGSVLEV